MRIHRTLGAAAAIAVCLAGSPAIAQIFGPPLVEIGNTGTIVLKGTAVGIELTVVCMGESPINYADARVYARSGSKIINGFGQNGSSDPTQAIGFCSSQPSVVSVVVPSSSAPFHNGSAYVRATVTVCDPVAGTCSSGFDEDNIKLSKK